MDFVSALQDVHLFSTKRAYYAYDAHTNAIVRMPDDMWLRLEKAQREVDQKHQHSGSRALEILQQVLREAGLRSHMRMRAIVPSWSRRDADVILSSQLAQLTLVVTHQCNLRCDYCLYGGLYPSYRDHADATMSTEVAEAAIRYFFEHSRSDQNVSISFYGGEPLLNSDLIAYCVEYARSVRGDRVRFSMTTNGTLMGPTEAKLLDRYDVSLLVSLDGPRGIHDLHRHYPTGTGSFGSTMSNLVHLKEVHPEYFGRNVAFNAVVAPDVPLVRVYDFFRANDALFGNNIVRVSGLIQYPPQALDQFGEGGSGAESLRDALLESASRETLEEDTFLRAVFERNLVRIHKRRHWDGFEPYHPPNGICLPGARKLLVEPDGSFRICERVATSETIGSVDQGLDHDRVWDLVDEYVDLCSGTCPDCWAIRLCSMCFASVFDVELSVERRDCACRAMRSSLSADLSLYCEILEQNPHALDYMKDLVLS